MRRKALAVVALVAVVATSGCLGFFSGISQQKLCQDADYDFETDDAATYTITTDGTYQAVYNISGRKRIELFKTDGLGNEKPLRIRAVQFVAADGTTYGCKEVDVRTTRHRTIITLPENEGQLAFTVRSQPKRFVTRTAVDGSHEVILPPNRSVSNPLFGSVRPGGYETTTDERNRVHIRWESMDARRIVVQYYLRRDIPILLGIIGVAGLAALGGLAFYYRKVRRLRRRREEAGLDVDIDDDDGRDPPPGMG